MVRGKVDGFNLAIGEPLFLREKMERHYPRTYPTDVGYPDTKPLPFLEEELRRLHPEGEIVVTCGAKQALHAAIHAMAVPEGDLLHPVPSWPSYGSLAEIHGLNLVRAVEIPLMTVSVNSCPNNPDGSMDSRDCDIWDAAYAHSVYGYSQYVRKPFAHRVSVWSAGKMLGSPGIRVGWLVTKDKGIAEAARRYVEQATSGVPVTSQYHAAYTLWSTQRTRQDIFRRARETLLANFALTTIYLDEHIQDLTHYATRVERAGMFLWFKARDPIRFAAALERSGVLLVPGSAFGNPEAGVYRMSMGMPHSYTEDAVKMLAHYLENT